MPIPQDDLDLFLQQLKDVYEDLWKQSDNDFYEHRKEWQKVADRKATYYVDPKWEDYAKGIQIEDPMIEEDIGVHVQVLNLEKPKLDVINKETTIEGKKQVEEVRIALAKAQEKLNPGNRLGLKIDRDQVVRGVAVVALDWKEPVEPTEDDYKAGMGDAYSEDVADANVATARGEFRYQHFAKQKDNWPFSARYVDVMQCCWSPLGEEEKNLFFHQYQVSYSEFQRIKPKYGKKMSVNHLGHCYIMGEKDPIPEDSAYQPDKTKKFDIVVRAMKMPDTGRWKVTEYIKGSGDEWKDGECFNEYDVPFNCCPYFTIPSGDEDPTSTIPHLRFRPKIYPLTALVNEYNQLFTEIVVINRVKTTDLNLYVNALKTNPDWAQKFGIPGGAGEGTGASTSPLAKVPQADALEIPVVGGEILRIPFEFDEHMGVRLTVLGERIKETRPNRFLIGQAIKESAESTATLGLDSRQAAKLPYEAYIKQEEKFWTDIHNAQIDCLIRWHDDNGVDTPYMGTANGEEPTLGGSFKPGKPYELNYEKLTRDFDVVIRKHNQSQAEKMQNDLATYQDYAQGSITETQKLKRLGFDDPNRQLEELEREKYRLMVQARLRPAMEKQIDILYSAMSGSDVTMMQPPTMPDGSNPPRGPQANEPSANALPLAGQVGPAVTVPPPNNPRPVGPTGV